MVRLSLNLLNSLNSPSAIDEPLSKSAWGHPTAKTSILILNREHRVRSTPTNFSHRHVRHECISRIWSPWFALLSNILSHGLPSNSVHSTYYRALYWILFDCHWFHQNFHSKQFAIWSSLKASHRTHAEFFIQLAGFCFRFRWFKNCIYVRFHTNVIGILHKTICSHHSIVTFSPSIDKWKTKFYESLVFPENLCAKLWNCRRESEKQILCCALLNRMNSRLITTLFIE